MRDSTRDRRPEGEQPLPLPLEAEMSLAVNPEGEKKLYHAFVYRFVEDDKDTTFPRMGPYTERKAAIVANRLTRILRTGGRLEEGVSYRPEKVQYAGPGTLPENAR